MRTLALSALTYLVVPNASEAFHHGRTSNPTSGQLLRLEARRSEMSALDSLRAKRLALRKIPEPEPSRDVRDEDDVAEGALVDGLEYLYDQHAIRDDDAPFHVILMPSTFQNPNVEIDHVATSCMEVLGMPYNKAHSLSMFAKYEGFSVLGTWTRKECLSLGERLREMDIECRLIPYDEHYKKWVCPDVAPRFDTDLLSYSS
eukprot:CCRYP_013759-RA/>CCRYP_013759-RA protein AED:0.11 eAED:0.11 QI:196/1/1/1/1/1/2/542/201